MREFTIILVILNDYNLDVYLAPPHMVLLLDIAEFVKQNNCLSYHFYVPHLGFHCFTSKFSHALLIFDQFKLFM